tara:strand:+ start:242 stop:1102 length:861 start_codon:yes stop_codon:yes gene_type:complete
MAIDTIKSVGILDGSIATADIADDAVTSAKLDTNIAVAGTLGVTGLTTLSGNANITGDTATLTLTDNSSHSANTGPAISFFSNDSGGTSREVAKIVGESHSGANEGNLALQTRNGGTLETKWKLFKNGNFIPSNSAYGIVLGNTTSTDANLLDDYEVGSWTPTTPNAGSMTNGDGRYVKVGKMVTVWCYIASISNTSSSNAFDIGGLPFTAIGTGTLDSTVGPVMIRYVDDNTTEPLTISSYISGGGTTLLHYISRGNNDSYGRVLHSHFNSGNIGYRTQLSYEVS